MNSNQNSNSNTNQIIYQTSNILENFYTDNYFNYILTSSLYTHRNSFIDILTYVQTYIPNWQPVTNDTNNRIVFNSNTMFELLFHKNIFIIIPLYISNYSALENDFFHIKQYCEKYILADNNNNHILISMINYKLIIYSTTTSHSRIKYKLIATNKTIINTTLYTNMYESFIFPLPEIIPFINQNQNFQTVNINPLYTPFKTNQTIQSRNTTITEDHMKT